MATETIVMVHIFVNKEKVEFHKHEVTGQEIKEKACVSLDSELYRKVHGNLELVQNDQTIHIKDGEHFIDLPAGTVS